GATLSCYRSRPLTSALSLSGSCAQRELHSFPTRRSSDLADRRPGSRRFAGTPRLGAGGRGGGLPLDRGRRHVRCRSGPAAEPARDRKSTRLNSSHVKTSYAVFCLKKKKTKQLQVRTRKAD